MELLLQILQATVLLLVGFYVAMLIGEKRRERVQHVADAPEERYVDVVPSSLIYGGEEDGVA